MTDAETLTYFLTMMGAGFIVGLVYSFFFDWINM